MKNLERNTWVRYNNYIVLIVLLVLFVTPYLVAGVAPFVPGFPFDLIVAPTSENWLISITTPLVRKMEHENRIPYFLIVDSTKVDKFEMFLKRAEPRNCVILESDQGQDLLAGLIKIPTHVVQIGSNPTEAGLLLAKTFWGSNKEVVVASLQEPEAMILGSELACQLKAPFIPIRQRYNVKELSNSFDSLGIQRVVVVVSRKNHLPVWAVHLEQKKEILDIFAVQYRLIEKLGAQNIQNIILTRIPATWSSEGQASWLAPYLSLVRKSSIILVNSSDPEEAEEKVGEYIENYGLKPRSLTILADYDSIGMIQIQDHENLAEYEVAVEPGSRPIAGHVSALGVGRLPFTNLEDTSAFIAFVMAHERNLDSEPPRILMIANPNSAYGPLPLAETVSRITAEEFKNFDIQIDEFYQTASNHPQARAAAQKAHLIIYEGHITDQYLFEDPMDIFEPEEEYQEYYEYEEPEINYPSVDIEYPSKNIIKLCSLSKKSIISPDDPNIIYKNGLILETSQHDKSIGLESSGALPYGGIVELEGLPLIALQSCHSLDNQTAQKVFDMGCTGLMGSLTNIHSASGSAFVKAFCDGLLYRGSTVGEALRDARNYFLCLADLKSKRGHTEQAKVHRVALSFCLWGDPEMKIISTTRKPNRKSVKAKLIAPNIIHVSTPKRRLPQANTDKYFVRMFPCNQVAGIVKRLKQKNIRRILPIYFFRIPMPPNFDPQQYTKLGTSEEDTPRAVFMAEPFNRYLYVLYFPEKDNKGEKITLQFQK